MSDQNPSKGLKNNRKLNIFLFFLLLSFLFSMLTKLSADHTQSFSLEIKPVNIPEEKLIIKDSLHKLDVNLTTYGFKLVRYFINPPIVEIDMSRLDKKDRTLIWTQQKGYAAIVQQFDQNVQINTINPDSLIFDFDENAVKSVLVNLKEEVRFKPGFDLKNGFNIEPDSVRIIGPAAMLDTIEGVSTKNLNMNGVNESINVMLKLNAFDNDQIRLSQNEVRVSAEVTKFTEGEIKVPVILKNIPTDTEVTIYPKEVPVIFSANLERFDEIASSGFIVECDFDDVAGGQSFLVPKLVDYPEGIKNVRLKLKRIEYIISE